MSLRALGKQLGAFLSWWGVELAALLPERLRPAPDSRLTVSFGETGWLVIGRAGRDGWRELARVDTGLSDTGRLRAVLREAGAERLPVALRLGDDQALRRTLSLPLAAEENLYETVAFQLDRHTPFSIDSACCGVRVLRRDEDAQTIEVELAVTPRALIDGLVGRLEGLGAVPTVICVASDGEEGGGHGDLVLVREDGPAPRAGTARLVLALGGGALMLALANVAVPLVQRASEAHAAEAEAAELRTRAAATADLRRAVEQDRWQALFAVKRKQTMPAMEAVLAELTRLMPDDTWVTHVQIDGVSAHVTGFSGSANALIAVLEQSPLFARAMFRAPLTQDPVHGVEQFHLGVDLRPRGDS